MAKITSGRREYRSKVAAHIWSENCKVGRLKNNRNIKFFAKAMVCNFKRLPPSSLRPSFLGYKAPIPVRYPLLVRTKQVTAPPTLWLIKFSLMVERAGRSAELRNISSHYRSLHVTAFPPASYTKKSPVRLKRITSPLRSTLSRRRYNLKVFGRGRGREKIHRAECSSQFRPQRKVFKTH